MPLVLNSRLENALRSRPWSLPESLLRDIAQKGFVDFRSSKGTFSGTLLIDDTLESPIRVVTYDSLISPTYVAACVKEAWAFRSEQASKGTLDTGPAAAFRLINQTGDGLPGIAVDVYAGFAHVQLYAGAWRRYLQSLVDALGALPGILGIYLTDRTRSGKQESRHLAGQRARAEGRDDCVLVNENGLIYPIELASGPATGLYLDQRSNRLRLTGLLRGGRLLNTFSYTCSFGLQAAAKGSHTVNVDLAKAALEQGKAAYVRNGIDVANHLFMAEDVFLYLPRLAKRQEKFRAVLLDPPTFARGKKGTFSTEKNYGALVAVAAPLVEANGYLVAFANTHRMTEDQWLASVQEGLGDLRREFQPAGVWGQDVDFRVRSGDPAGHYLKNIVLQRTDALRR